MSVSDRVRIHYRRLPTHERIFDQRVVYEDDSVIVTLSDPLQLEAPLEIDGRVALETGSRAVWFTFPGLWHDIGRFHRADGTFTGCYANVLTPPRIEGSTWHTTDLFLDVWMPADGGAQLLDEDELAAALADGFVDADLAERARSEAATLLAGFGDGSWPPPVVGEWKLDRILGGGA